MPAPSRYWVVGAGTIYIGSTVVRQVLRYRTMLPLGTYCLAKQKILALYSVPGGN